MGAIQVSIIARFIPPATLVFKRTVATILIIVTIVSAELHAIRICHCIFSLPHTSTNSQSVLILWSSHRKGLVGPGHGGSILEFHIDPQLMGLSGCQAVDVTQSQPELFRQVSKSVFIVCPVSSEVFSASRNSFLNDNPPTTISTHVTVDKLLARTMECTSATNITNFISTILFGRIELTNLL